MAVTQRLQPALKTGIALTPQLQQTIALIQKTKAELVELVQQELDANPALEESIGPDPDAQAAELEAAEKNGSASDPALGDESPDDWDTGRWEGYRDEMQWRSGVRGGSATGQPIPIDNILANSETLADHLNGQIGLLLNSETEIGICEAIIGCLNDAGYLEATLEEIQHLGGGDWSLSDVERGLERVQSLEPYGVGARNVRECWLLQLCHGSLNHELAEAIVRDHCDVIELKQSDELARRLGATVDQLREALSIINRLDREPGLTLVPRQTGYLFPDVKVVKEDSTFRVEFIDEGMPRVRVNPKFASITKKNEHRVYRQEKLESAKNLLKSIDQRKMTILKVAKSIVNYQMEFMNRGALGLRPLVLREVADEIEMHESTVSRVVHNKAMVTPQGVLPMKYFFPTRIPCRNGEDVSSVVVKLKIGGIIRREDPKKPLSDAKIHSLLKANGYELARRTVAKYREELQLPNASQRKDLLL